MENECLKLRTPTDLTFKNEIRSKEIEAQRKRISPQVPPSGGHDGRQKGPLMDGERSKTKGRCR
jgi:hypothetical protein